MLCYPDELLKRFAGTHRYHQSAAIGQLIQRFPNVVMLHTESTCAAKEINAGVLQVQGVTLISE